MDNERTLSYQLATELSYDELDSISGGVSGTTTTNTTMKPTGNNPSNADVDLDVAYDWT